MKKYRDQGAIGALLDEYEKANNELKAVILPLSQAQLELVVDHETKDQDCRSIQTILTHVVASGFGYVYYIRRHQGELNEKKKKRTLDNIQDFIKAIDLMFEANVELFVDYPDINLNEYNDDKKVQTDWGQRYDVDGLMEHAIMHILRHRRQIERFLLKM